jgi:hypothetical protein
MKQSPKFMPWLTLLYIEQHSSGILDDLNNLNFCGLTFASTYIGYVNSLNTVTNANLSTTVITYEAL